MNKSFSVSITGCIAASDVGECCSPIGPVVSGPPPPRQILLTAGAHTLFIDATTSDPLHHFGALHQFGLTFEAAP